MRREYPKRPIVAVTAVVFCENAVLLVKRSHEPGRGQWSLPGGAVELGETLLEAITRELREEANVDIRLGGLIHVYDRIVSDPDQRVKYHYVLVTYWGELIRGNLSPGSDISQACLVPLSEIEAFHISEELKGTIKEAVKLRDGHLGPSPHF